MKFYIKTYGCQMNLRDSESASVMLTSQGYIQTQDENEADILIFNTCSVREGAEQKAIGKLGILKRLKRKRPEIFIGVMGCMAQSKGAEILKQVPHVDFIIGTEQLQKLPEIVNGEIEKRYKEVQIDSDMAVLGSLSGHIVETEKSVSAYIAIMRGCNRFCSYCIVPFVRGREKSRAVQGILDEVTIIVKEGIKEICLLGQNVAAFGLDGQVPSLTRKESPFAELLTELNKIEGLERIRFMSPHPAYISDTLIDAIVANDKVCNNLHLPLQSGSNNVLKLMNRPYTAEDYLSIVEKLKAKSPEMTFSTDIIVGFPEETEDDFNATVEMMNKVKFHNAYIFKYSPRKGTKAAEMEDQIDDSVKEERNKALLATLKKNVEEINENIVGKTYSVLVEGPSKRNKERWAGRNSENNLVIFSPKNDVKIGDIVQVKIDKTTPSSFFGDIV